MARFRPEGITQAERQAREAEQARQERNAAIIARLRAKGYEFRDDLNVLAQAVRYLYQQSGITPPQPLVEWWQAFQDAEAEVDGDNA
jgi:hypothetical protein